MVSSKDCDSIAITEFQGDKEGDGLDGIVASVDIVSHEEVVGLGGVTTDAEQFG